MGEGLEAWPIGLKLAHGRGLEVWPGWGLALA
jgi:hypothetical protein